MIYGSVWRVRGISGLPLEGDVQVAIVEHASFVLFCGTISCYEKEEEAKHGAELNRHQGYTRA